MNTNYSEADCKARAMASRARIDARLVDAVSRKLGVSAQLLRYDRDRRTGADIPVFGVPASALDAAHTLGLTVEAA